MNINKFNINYKNGNLLNDIIKYFKNDTVNTRSLYMDDPFWKDFEKDIQVSNKNDGYSNIEINGDTIFLNTYILNKHKNNYDLLEKFVFESACYHLCNLGKSINDENICIEFWFSQTNFDYQYNSNFHYDASETDQIISNEIITPILTTVTYFSTCNHTPTIITNIKKNNVEKENNSDSKEFWFSFPIENTQTSFLGGINLHGPCFTKKNNNNQKRYILNIQIFDKPISKRMLYKNKFEETYSRNTNFFDFENNTSIHKISKTDPSLKHIYNKLTNNININSNIINANDYRFKEKTQSATSMSFTVFNKIFEEEKIDYKDIICLCF